MATLVVNELNLNQKTKHASDATEKSVENVNSKIPS